MVVCTVATVSAVLTTREYFVRGIALGGAVAAAFSIGTPTATASATGVAASVGAITGAMATSDGGGAFIGALTGGASVLGVGSFGTGAGALVAGTGGFGLIVVGTCQSSADNHITYDCWKPVVHDTSVDPSKGMLLADLLRHKNVAKLSVTEGTVPGLPRIALENVWNESFEIEYVVLPETGELASHAKRLPDKTLNSQSRGLGQNICSGHC